MGFLNFLKGTPRVRFEGGPGDSIKTAIIIRGAPDTSAGVTAEYEYLAQVFGERGEDWELVRQSLVSNGARRFDRIEITLEDGEPQALFFDITEFFGKF